MNGTCFPRHAQGLSPTTTGLLFPEARITTPKGGRRFEATRHLRATPGYKIWTLNHTVFMCKFESSRGIIAFEGWLVRTADGHTQKHCLAASQRAYPQTSSEQIHARPPIDSTNIKLHPQCMQRIPVARITMHSLHTLRQKHRLTPQSAALSHRTVSKTKGHPFLNDPSTTSQIQGGPLPATT